MFVNRPSRLHPLPNFLDEHDSFGIVSLQPSPGTQGDSPCTLDGVSETGCQITIKLKCTPNWPVRRVFNLIFMAGNYRKHDAIVRM